MDQKINCMNSMLQKREQQFRHGMAGVYKEKESSWQRHNASTDGVTQDTPSAGTRTLHPRPVKENRATGHHEEE